MSKTKNTISLFEQSPTKELLPVRTKSPQSPRKSLCISQVMRRSTSYSIPNKGYHNRKSFKMALPQLFSLSNLLLLSTKFSHINLSMLSTTPSLLIPSDSITYVQNNPIKKRPFKDYLIHSNKVKDVLPLMNDIYLKAENMQGFVPKIKCQIDVVNHGNSYNNSKVITTATTPKTQRSNYRSNKSKSPKNPINNTEPNQGHMTRLQKEKNALKESRIKTVMSKSPHNKDNQKPIKKKKIIVPSKSVLQLNKKSQMYTNDYQTPKKSQIIGSDINKNNDINASTLKKLQAMKEQLEKMKIVSSKEQHDSEDEKNYSNNILNDTYKKTNIFLKTQSSFDDQGSSNSRPLNVVLKTYLN